VRFDRSGRSVRRKNMTDKLDLSLPERERPAPRRPGTSNLLLTALLIAVAMNVFLGLAGRRRTTGPCAPAPNVLPAEPQKQLALRLEKQGLHEAAADAWREYISVAPLDKESTARIWFRIGTLRQEAGTLSRALDAYYRSESFGRIDGLALEIGRRTQECLETMGKFAALRYELSERVGMDNTQVPDDVLAEIGPQKISKSELDRRMEEQIEQQLGQFAAFLPDEEKNKQKEALLKQFSSSTQRLRFLHQMIIEEVLYRKARESKITDDPEVRALLKAQERAVLAQKMIEREFADKIKITPGDLTTYYEAHKSEYVRPERARISHILTADEESARNAMEKLKGGRDFGELAREVSLDDSTREKGGEVGDWVAKGESVPGIGTSAEAGNLIFSTGQGKVAESFVKSEKGFHLIRVQEREEERQRTYDEVRSDIFRALRAQKEGEVQEALFAELKDRYDVVVHHSVFTDREKEE